MKKAWLGLGLALTLLGGCAPAASQAQPAPSPSPTLAAPAQSVVFDGDSYFLVDVSETRAGLVKEFLLDGQTFDDFTRKITFRLTPGKDLRALEKTRLAGFDKARPGYQQRVMYRSRKQLDEDFLFPDGEYQLWTWRLTPRGIESFEMLIRMKDARQLRALVDSRRELWRKDLERMGKSLPSILKSVP